MLKLKDTYTMKGITRVKEDTSFKIISLYAILQNILIRPLPDINITLTFYSTENEKSPENNA